MAEAATAAVVIAVVAVVAFDAQDEEAAVVPPLSPALGGSKVVGVFASRVFALEQGAGRGREEAAGAFPRVASDDASSLSSIFASFCAAAALKRFCIR